MSEAQPEPFVSPKRLRRHYLVSFWLTAGLIATVVATGSLLATPWVEGVLDYLGDHVAPEKAVYSPLAYFLLLSVVFLLERRIPVREQAFLSPSFCQDLLWYVGSMLLRVLFLGWYLSLLHSVYERYLSFLTIDAIAEWGALPRFILGVLAADFLRWASHLVRHKVPFFWSFHAVHHSQANLNLFTDARVHPVDRTISATLRFIPLMMLGNELPVILLWTIFETVYPKFYHANIRLNLGPLRYILVTPQSHRVHHASGVPYRDKNFGFTFSIWDRLFGTQYRDDNDYPPTGVEGIAYPAEEKFSPFAQLRVFAQLLILPFRGMFRGRKACPAPGLTRASHPDD